MEIIKITFIFTTLAVTTSIGHNSPEPEFLEPPLSVERYLRLSTDTSDPLPLPDQDVDGGDDHDYTHQVTSNVVPVDESVPVNLRSLSTSATLEEEKLLNRHGEPQNLVQLLQNHRNYEENVDNDDCICYKGSNRAPVSQHINPEGSDLQRVVVYFYIKRGDPKVHLYIPDVQKQHYIPDLPLEEYDLLQALNSDILLRLLNNNPFSVTKKVFKTRPDYDVKRVVRPDVDEFRSLLNELLLSRPQFCESLIRINQSKLPKQSRKRLLTGLHSLGLSWDGLLDNLKNNFGRDQIPDFEQLVPQREQVKTSYRPVVEVPSYEDYSVEFEPPFKEPRVLPTFQQEPAYKDYKIIGSSHVDHHKLENVPSYENNFVLGQEEYPEGHFLPSFEDNGAIVPPEHNSPLLVFSTDLPVPVVPTDFPKYTLPDGIEEFATYHEQRPPREPYNEFVHLPPSREKLPVPVLTSPESLLAYKPQIQSQESYEDYSEPALPSVYVTEIPYEEPVHPTGAYPIENQDIVFPTTEPATLYPEYSTFNPDYDFSRPTTELPWADQQSPLSPFLPTQPLPQYEAFNPVPRRPTFDKYPPDSYEGTPTDAGSYPNRPGQLPKLNEEDKYPDYSIEVFPTRPSQHEEYPVELYPTRPARFPTFDESPPTHEIYPTDSRTHPATLDWFPTPDTLKPYQSEDDIYSHQREDGIHPYQSEDGIYPYQSDNDIHPHQSEDGIYVNLNDYSANPAKTGKRYPVDGQSSNPEHRRFPDSSEIEDPWYPVPHVRIPQGHESFTFPFDDKPRGQPNEKKFYDYLKEDDLYALPWEPQEHPQNYEQSNLNQPNNQWQLDLSQKPFGSLSWEQERPEYEVKTEYSRQPKLVLPQQLRTVLDQPQRLDLIIKYLKQLRSQPNYVINHKTVQQPGQLDLALIQRLLNPEYSYGDNGSQRPQALEHFRDPTFEKWFEGQVVDLGNKFGEVNVDSLKVLIEGILRHHNLMFTKEGVLINKYGNTLNVGELKLRPILIGNSVDVGIKSLLEDAINKKIKIAHDSPYLHGLLVSLGTPPHVLGLVPLGYRSAPGKLNLSDKLVKKPVTERLPGPTRFQNHGFEQPQDNGVIHWTQPGQSKVYSWTSPIQTIKYHPQVIRKTFKNVPLDKEGLENFLAKLNLSNFGNRRITIVRPGQSEKIPLENNFDDLKSWFNLNLPEFGNKKIVDEQKYGYSYLPGFNENVEHTIETPYKYHVYPSGAPTDLETPELQNLLSLKQPQYRPTGSGSLSLNAGLPSLNANGKLGLNVGANLDRRFNRIDLGQLKGILSGLPNVVPPEFQVGIDDAAQLNDAADLVLDRAANLGVPGVQLNADLGAGLQSSLDGLLSSREHGTSVDLDSDVKVPAGIGKDFEFTEYPVEQVHAAADAPEFRIIGGNAATGSGTPLSNKGKTGPVIL